MNNVSGFRKVRIGNVLKEYVTESQMLEALAAYLELEIGNVEQMQVDLHAVEKIPMELAEKYCMLAVAMEGDTLTVLTNDPLNFYGLENIHQVTGMDLQLLLCNGQAVENAIRYYYSEIRARHAAEVANNSQYEGAEELALEEDEGAPVVNLLDSLVRRAFHNNASDIHIEPFEDKTTVRMRIDGVILEFVTLQRSLHASLIARIKILGDMDIAERRVPQDGHFRMTVDGQMVNMRTSIFPTVFGEKAVIRLLFNHAVIDHSKTFGMQEDDYEKLLKILKCPNGLIYLTGPTGSGKTTTLYMILNELAKRQVNICTIEDPVEQNLEHVNQSQVNNMAGLSFESGLRALLRQDPDIIMVGETRDRETAAISVRAAITGHLVLSTLHTNDALSAIVRLQDMGVEPYMAANSLVGVVAQRLMRKLCPECAREVETDAQMREYLGVDIMKVKAPVGCVRCNYTGYSGRTAIHEVVYVDKRMRQMIASGDDLEEIKSYAVRKQGMKTLKESGLKLVEQGITSVDELFKVVYYD